ncbi:MAG: glycosyltransferase family 2 protein [Myxococcales bacterium]|nr:MAG: glycosyltransferase family 2 protein [Myxococcales bacterium]
MTEATRQRKAIDALERRLDGAPFAWAARAWTARAKRGSRFSPADVYRQVASGTSPEEQSSALRQSIRLGGWETAEILGRSLKTHLAQLPLATRGDVVASLLELRLGLGQRAEAAAWAAEHHELLATNPRGVALLETVGLPQPAWMVNGQPNLSGLSKRVGSGQLDTEALVALFSRRPWCWITAPEALLLPIISARSEELDVRVRFLNRFLRVHGVPPLDLRADCEPDNVLGALHRRVPRRRGGPLVSVLVAARNAERTLDYALQSLLEQTHANLEVLVADDASSDATALVIRRYAQDARVRAFRSTENQGAYNTRNALARLARGEFLTFHDADDFAVPERIEAQLKALSASGARASSCGLLRLNADGGVAFFKDHHALRLCRASLFLRRDTFWDLGGLRSARFGADEELYAKVGARWGSSSVRRVVAPLVLSLWSPTSATRVQGSESLEDGFRSPARRAYSELIFQKYVVARDVTEAELHARLAETDNHLVPRPIAPLD